MIFAEIFDIFGLIFLNVIFCFRIPLLMQSVEPVEQIHLLPLEAQRLSHLFQKEVVLEKDDPGYSCDNP